MVVEDSLAQSHVMHTEESITDCVRSWIFVLSHSVESSLDRLFKCFLGSMRYYPPTISTHHTECSTFLSSSKLACYVCKLIKFNISLEYQHYFTADRSLIV